MPGKIRPSADWTQLGANVATIIAAVVGIITLLHVQRTLRTAQTTLEEDRETKTIEWALKYDDLMGDVQRDSSWKNLAGIDIETSGRALPPAAPGKSDVVPKARTGHHQLDRKRLRNPS
jgi:hypothetical protein